MDSLTFFSLAGGALMLVSLVRFFWYGIIAARHSRHVHNQVTEYRRAINAAHRRIT